MKINQQHAFKKFRSNLTTVYLATLIGIPFLYYAFFIHRKLTPVVVPDSFSYLWTQAFSPYYLTGRSLTQRIVFTLFANKIELIQYAQLFFFFFSAALTFLVLSYQRSTAMKIILAILLSLIYSSFTLNISSVIIAPEPIQIALLMAFPFALFLDRYGHYNIVVIVIGILFIFSRNVAPYICITLICLRIIVSKGQYLKKALFPSLFLVSISLCSMLITFKYDTSVQINGINNIFRRVFVSPKRVQYFSENFGMPTGSFIKQCKGKRITQDCLGLRILKADATTRNYKLIDRLSHDGLAGINLPEQHKARLMDEIKNINAFLNWIKTKGQKSYIKYILFVSPKATYREYRKNLEMSLNNDTALLMNNYMSSRLPDQFKKTFNPKMEIGFLGLDPLTIIKNILTKLQFDKLEIVLGYITLGLILACLLKSSSQLALGSSLLFSSLVLFFLCFYGDAMEIKRHIAPAIILLIIGGFIYLFSLTEILLALFRKIIIRRG